MFCELRIETNGSLIIHQNRDKYLIFRIKQMVYYMYSDDKKANNIVSIASVIVFYKKDKS